MSAHLAAIPMACSQARLEQLLLKVTGMTLHRELARHLPAVFQRAASGLGLSGEAFLRNLAQDDARARAALIDEAVVGETYLLRHPEHFALLTDTLAPMLGRDRPLRIWSAGCASGEEPYSIALSLQLAGRTSDTIVATDLSERALSRARSGHYGEWSFRRVEEAVRARYFSPEHRASGPGFRVRPTLTRNLSFKRHDLCAGPALQPRFDVIFCRNVLIYFEGAQLEAAIRCLAGSLSAEGVLLVGPAEVPLVRKVSLDLEPVELSGVSSFRARGPVRAAAHSPAEAVRHRPSRRVPGHAPASALAEALPSSTRSAAPASSTPAASLAPSTPEAGVATWEASRRALEEGRVDEAERLAWELGASGMEPRAYLLAAMIAEGRGDLARAQEALRRAVYLAPTHPVPHAQQVALHRRLGRPELAERARLNALALLAPLPDSARLDSVEPLTAGALRRALEGTT